MSLGSFFRKSPKTAGRQSVKFGNFQVCISKYSVAACALWFLFCLKDKVSKKFKEKFQPQISHWKSLPYQNFNIKNEFLGSKNGEMLAFILKI